MYSSNPRSTPRILCCTQSRHLYTILEAVQTRFLVVIHGGCTLYPSTDKSSLSFSSVSLQHFTMPNLLSTSMRAAKALASLMRWLAWVFTVHWCMNPVKIVLKLRFVLLNTQIRLTIIQNLSVEGAILQHSEADILRKNRCSFEC